MLQDTRTACQDVEAQAQGLDGPPPSPSTLACLPQVPEQGTTFQPNPNSIVQSDRGVDHLDYFRFVGRIVGKVGPGAGRGEVLAAGVGKGGGRG